MLRDVSRAAEFLSAVSMITHRFMGALADISWASVSVIHENLKRGTSRVTSLCTECTAFVLFNGGYPSCVKCGVVIRARFVFTCVTLELRACCMQCGCGRSVTFRLVLSTWRQSCRQQCIGPCTVSEVAGSKRKGGKTTEFHQTETKETNKY